MWFKQDAEFLLPKAVVYIEMFRLERKWIIKPYWIQSRLTFLCVYQPHSLLGSFALLSSLSTGEFVSWRAEWIHLRRWSRWIRICSPKYQIWSSGRLHLLLFKTFFRLYLTRIVFGNEFLKLSLKGYNDKLPTLLQKLIEKLTTFVVDPQRFKILKESYVRALQNFR